MSRRYSQFLELIYLIGDILILNLAFIIGLFWRHGGEWVPVFNKLQDETVINQMVFMNLAWFVLIKGTSYYTNNRRLTLDKIAIKFFRVYIFLILIMSLYFTILRADYSRVHFFVTFMSFALLSLIWRLSLDTVLKNYRSAGFNFRRIVLVGANESSRDFAREIMEHEEYGYRILGFFDNRDPDYIRKKFGVEIAGDLNYLKTYCIQNNIDEIYCALSADEEDVISDLIDFSDDHLVRMRIVPAFSSYRYGQTKKLNIEYFGNMPVLTFRQEPLESMTNRAMKRFFDFGFSLFVLIFVFSWLMPIIAILIKLNSKGPVFFKQKRTGENNKEFLCYKFRTMQVNDDSDSKQASKDDSRITSVGRVLRKTNLDELPQFFNVLAGHMSVVGPRPHMLKHTEQYSKVVDKFMVRHFIKPGITGMAQVKGYRGETKDPRLMEKRVQYDVWYVENWSFLLDLKIVWLTVWNMLRGEKNAW